MWHFVHHACGSSSSPLGSSWHLFDSSSSENFEPPFRARSAVFAHAREMEFARAAGNKPPVAFISGFQLFRRCENLEIIQIHFIVVPVNFFPAITFAIFRLFPSTTATWILFAWQNLEAIGSNGAESPGSHRSPTIFR